MTEMGIINASGEAFMSVMAAHSEGPEVVMVECTCCDAFHKVLYTHDASDAVIARECFPGWRVKGVRGAKHTRCPKCVSLRRTPHAARAGE